MIILRVICGHMIKCKTNLKKYFTHIFLYISYFFNIFTLSYTERANTHRTSRAKHTLLSLKLIKCTAVTLKKTIRRRSVFNKYEYILYYKYDILIHHQRSTRFNSFLHHLLALKYSYQVLD